MESVFTQLDREWTHLEARPSTAAALLSECTLAGVSSPPDLVRAVRQPTPTPTP